MKNITWHKITPKKLPPLYHKVLLFNNQRVWIDYATVFDDTTYKGYIDNDWTHWAYVNLPKFRK
jgi:hypothetical protein